MPAGNGGAEAVIFRRFFGMKRMEEVEVIAGELKFPETAKIQR